MANFGPQSETRLQTCDARLQKVLREAIKVSDFTVLCGHRDKEGQDQVVAEGKSKAPWPTSKHNTSPSLAVDIAPWPIDWNNRERFFSLSNLILQIAHEQGVKLRWGGNFKGLSDLPHFEIVE